MDPVIPREKTSRKDIPDMPVALAAAGSEAFSHVFRRRETTGDPLVDLPPRRMEPLKVGVTALCRAMEENTQPTDEEENAETKRFPLTASQPRLLSSLPAMPAFLEPPKEETALLTGVETHRALSLIQLDLIRPVAQNPKAIYARVCAEVERMVNEGVITARQSDFVSRKMIAGFFESDLGQRMLQSPRVMREWAFNLRVREPFVTTAQGVIDLCFLENGAWVLVDFKTDRCDTAAELWPRYQRQLSFYRRALETATPYPVSQTVLYALRVGEAYAENNSKK